MKRLIAFLLLISSVAVLAQSIQAVPLLSLRMVRQGFENAIWMEQRARIGDESVSGYIQGIGGADDALMGFELKDDFDLLEVTIGYLSSTPEGRSASFSVEAAGVTLFESGKLESRSNGHRVRVPIKGHRRFLLRISPDRYNGTAGAAWGAPTLYSGVPASELEPNWSLEVNGQRSPLPGSNPPVEISLPLEVPMDGEREYRVRVQRDPAGRLIRVEREQVEP